MMFGVKNDRKILAVESRSLYTVRDSKFDVSNGPKLLKSKIVSGYTASC